MATVELTDRDRVEEVVRDVRFERYRDWSREELLCHPADAAAVCVEVRMRTGLAWPDDLILWCLFPAGRRRRRS